MPQLPRYESQRSLNAGKPGVVRQEPSSYDIASQAIGQVQQVAFKWKEAVDTMQYTTAKANFETGLLDIESRAAADQEYNNSEQYYKELEELRKNSVIGIEDKMVASNAAMEFKHKSQITRIKIDNEFKNKMIDFNRKVTIPTAVEALLKKKVMAAPSEFNAINAEINKLLSDNVEKGFLSPVEKEKILSDAEFQAAEMEVYADPIQGKADIEAGLYAISDKDKSNLIKKADDLSDWQNKQMQTQGAFDLSQSLMDGTLSRNQITTMQRQGNISPEVAAIFNEVLEKGKFPIPDTTKLGKPDYFLSLLDESLDDKTEVMAILKDATKAYRDNVIGDNQYAYFVQEAKKKFDRYNKGGTWYNKAVKWGVEAIKSFLNKSGKKDEIPETLQDYIGSDIDGKEEQAAQSIIQEKVKNMIPDMINFPKGGQLMMDANGNKAIIYEDGTIEEVK